MRAGFAVRPVKSSAFFVIIILIILITTISAGATVRVEPSRYILTYYPGARITESVNVTNQTDRTLNLIASFYDWNLDEKYELETYQRGTLDSSFDGYLRFNPRRFTLSPGESQIVRFTITIPEEENNRERRGIIFIEHEDLLDVAEIGAAIVTRIGTTVYAVPAEQEFIFTLKETQIIKNDLGDIFGAYLTSNDGEIHVRYRVKYSIISAEGRKIEEGEIEERVLLPDTERGVIFRIQSELEPGDYQLISKFSFPGSSEELNEAINFTVR